MLTADGSPLVAGSGSSITTPPQIPSSVAPPSSAPGPLAQAIGRLIGNIDNAGTSQQAFPQTSTRPGSGTIANLASNYGTRSIDYNTGGQGQTTTYPTNLPKHVTLSPAELASINNIGNLNQYLAGKTNTETPYAKQQIQAAASRGPQPAPVAPVKTSAAHTSSGSASPSPSTLAQLSALAGGGGGALPGSTSINKQATDLVTAQFQPLLDELNRQLAQDQAVYGQQSAQVKADEARLGDNAQTIYGLLHNQFGELQGQSDQQYQGTEHQVGSAYDQLMQQLGGIYGNAGQQLQGDLSQLGLNGAADNFGNHSLVDNYSLLRGLADVGRTNTLGNLATEGQGFHSLLGNEAQQALATGDERQSAVDTLAQKELIQLQNNLQNQLDAINKQKININTEKGQQIAAMREKLQTALTQTNNQLAIQEAKLQQGAEKIGLSRDSLDQRINQNNFSNQLALTKLNKAGGTAATNKTKLGQAETNLSNDLGGNDQAVGTALAGLTNNPQLFNLITGKASGAITPQLLAPIEQTLQQQYGTSPTTAQRALMDALLALTGYGTK